MLPNSTRMHKAHAPPKTSHADPNCPCTNATERTLGSRATDAAPREPVPNNNDTTWRCSATNRLHRERGLELCHKFAGSSKDCEAHTFCVSLGGQEETARPKWLNAQRHCKPSHPYGGQHAAARTSSRRRRISSIQAKGNGTAGSAQLWRRALKAHKAAAAQLTEDHLMRRFGISRRDTGKYSQRESPAIEAMFLPVACRGPTS